MNVSQKQSKEIASDFFLLNGNTLSSSEFNQKTTTLYPSFYEVIRVIDGIPLFFEEHIQRLVQSLQLLNFKLPYDESTIKKQIHTLIQINKCYNYNVKIVVNNLNNKVPNLFMLMFIFSHLS